MQSCNEAQEYHKACHHFAAVCARYGLAAAEVGMVHATCKPWTMRLLA